MQRLDEKSDEKTGPHLAAEWFAILKFRLELLQGQIMAIAIRRLSESEIPVGKR